MRRLFTVLSFLSLLLCTATIASWARSYLCIDYMRYTGHQDRLIVLNGDGEVHFLLMRFQVSWFEIVLTHRVFHNEDLEIGGTLAYSVYTLGNDGVSLPVGEMSVWMPRFQREQNQTSSAGTYDGLWLSFPHWMPACLFALSPALYARGIYRRRSNMKRGLCPTCSYNLTGNTSGVCPECGNAIPATSPADPAKSSPTIRP
jgi:hypothetical protein